MSKIDMAHKPMEHAMNEPYYPSLRIPLDALKNAKVGDSASFTVDGEVESIDKEGICLKVKKAEYNGKGEEVDDDELESMSDGDMDKMMKKEFKKKNKNLVDLADESDKE